MTNHNNNNGHCYLAEPYHVPELVLSISHELFLGLKDITSEST